MGLQIVLLAVACVFLIATRSQGALSPVRMFMYGWLIVLGTTVSGMVQYEQPMAMMTFWLVLATLCAFAGGAYLGRRDLTPEERTFGKPRDDMDRLTLVALCTLAAVGAILVASDLVGGGAAIIGNFGTEASIVRNTYWSESSAGQADATPLRSLRFYGVVACLAVATLLPYATREKRRLLQVVTAVAALVVVADSLLSAARFSIGVLAVCLLVSASLVYGGDSLRRVFTLRRLLIGGALCFYLFVVFPTQRNPDLAGAAESAVQHGGDARIAEWVAESGQQWLQIFAYSTSYFSTALDKLNYFATETDVFSWNTMGAYNFPQFGSGTWYQVREDIAALMAGEGWAPNPWSTGIRDLGIDFGLFTLLAAAVLGFLAQYLYDKSVAKRSYVGLITATYISVSCLIFAFLSPFQIRIISSGFLLLAAIAFAHWLLGGVSRKHLDVHTAARVPHRASGDGRGQIRLAGNQPGQAGRLSADRRSNNGLPG